MSLNISQFEKTNKSWGDINEKQSINYNNVYGCNSTVDGYCQYVSF